MLGAGRSLHYAGEYGIAGVTVALAEGIGLTVEIEADVLPLLFELTSPGTIRAAARAAELEPADVLPTVRRLLEHGLLELQGS
jgi:hypothetical protein